MFGVLIMFELYEDPDGGLHAYQVDELTGTVFWGMDYTGDYGPDGPAWYASQDWAEVMELGSDPAAAGWESVNDPAGCHECDAQCSTLIASSGWARLPYGIDRDACGASGLELSSYLMGEE